MKLLSINVGLPREVEWRGKAVRTSIFKAPVPGRVRVMRLNVDGDRQSDLSVHGGTDKAVYAYSSEHYAFWRNRPDMVKRFLRSGRTGFYLAVLREGDIGAGDSIDLVAGDD
ncbi:MAG: MOSC domain-containing protein, partial [Betaproteobacteria bacterium]